MNISSLEDKLKRIRASKLNVKFRYDMLLSSKKRTYKRKLFEDKDKSLSIQILEKYILNKDKFNLHGVNKNHVRLNKNVMDFIDAHELKVTSDRII